jgi:uncharacterized NAD-dependent epimerase/dehydratase family protein
VIDATIRAGRLTNQAIQCIGIAVNTEALDDAAARDLLAATGRSHRLPCVDPMRTGVAPLVDALAERFPV